MPAGGRRSEEGSSCRLSLAVPRARCRSQHCWPRGARPTGRPPPETRVEVVTDTIHGVEIPDPYRWLEDQDSPETRAWIDAQNEYARQIVSDTALEARLAARLSELMEVAQVSAPREASEFELFTLRRPGELQARIYRREKPEGEPTGERPDPDREYELLLDAQALGFDDWASVDIVDISPDGKLLLYRIRDGGARRDHGAPLRSRDAGRPARAAARSALRDHRLRRRGRGLLLRSPVAGGRAASPLPPDRHRDERGPGDLRRGLRAGDLPPAGGDRGRPAAAPRRPARLDAERRLRDGPAKRRGPPRHRGRTRPRQRALRGGPAPAHHRPRCVQLPGHRYPDRGRGPVPLVGPLPLDRLDPRAGTPAPRLHDDRRTDLRGAARERRLPHPGFRGRRRHGPRAGG